MVGLSNVKSFGFSTILHREKIFFVGSFHFLPSLATKPRPYSLPPPIVTPSPDIDRLIVAWRLFASYYICIFISYRHTIVNFTICWQQSHCACLIMISFLPWDTDFIEIFFISLHRKSFLAEKFRSLLLVSPPFLKSSHDFAAYSRYRLPPPRPDFLMRRSMTATVSHEARWWWGQPSCHYCMPGLAYDACC